MLPHCFSEALVLTLARLGGGVSPLPVAPVDGEGTTTTFLEPGVPPSLVTTVMADLVLLMVVFTPYRWSDFTSVISNNCNKNIEFS